MAFTDDLLISVCTALNSESEPFILPVDCPVFGSTHFSTCKDVLSIKLQGKQGHW